MALTKNKNISLNITVFSESEAQEKTNLLQQLASNLDHDVLKIIAQKSRQKGINEKVKKFKSLL